MEYPYAITGGLPYHPYSLSNLIPQHQQHYNDIMVLGRDIGTTTLSASTNLGVYNQTQYGDCLDYNTTATITVNQGGFDPGTTRWPRQETLILLEVRTRLDYKFKVANQKAPLWDEVARVMCEEYGYQRSGKKCREKFENLYKYYKKTKEGKAGRQDGKHYRFFRQLDSLYGHEHHPSTTHASDAHIIDNCPTTQYHQSALLSVQHQPSKDGCGDTSVSHSLESCDLNTSSSDFDLIGLVERKKAKKRNWKTKIKEYIELQMREVIEKQESWVDKMMKTIESKEYERIVKGGEWRKEEVDRIEREHKIWASERAWIEARDLALMSTLEKLTNNSSNGSSSSDQWPEHEITKLVQVTTSMESRFQQCELVEHVLWEEIATKMAYFGYDRSGIDCKEKWVSISESLHQEKGKSPKSNNENYQGLNHHEGGIYMNNLSGFNSNCWINNNNNIEMTRVDMMNNKGLSSTSSNDNSNINVIGGSNVVSDTYLRFFLGEGYT